MKNLLIGCFLATASILYELILAQILNLSLGGTIFQYTITIGIYATALGIGSLWYQKTNLTLFQDKTNSLYKIELMLAGLGITSLFFTYILQYLFFIYQLPIIGFQLIIYVLIFIIGLLSGLELPLLMDINTSNSNSFSSRILFVDYLGTLFGCILFPLVLMPYLNLLQILFFTALINTISSGVITQERYKKIISFFISLIITGLFYYSENLSAWLSFNFVS